jgi:predicted small lipoprotein YifL
MTAFRLAALFAAVAAVAGCGKKGPPLAPIVHVPAAVEGLTARRVGGDVFLTFTPPATNVDRSTPPDVARIDVYGVTATTPPPTARFLEIATLLHTVTIEQPKAAQSNAGKATTPATPGPAPVAVTTPRHVRDPLTADALVPKALAAPPVPARRQPLPPAAGPAPAPAEPPVLRRYYVAIAASDRGRIGPPSAMLALPLEGMPDPPADVELEVSADSVSVGWPPSGGLVGYLADHALPFELAPFDEVAGAPAAAAAPMALAPVRYNLYRELGPDPVAVLLPVAAAAPPDPDAPPAPLNAQPLERLDFVDAVEFDRERCYVVRAVRGAGADAIEGEASPRRCVTPVDVYPPAAPAGLSAVSGEGSVSLIWEASADADVAGYLVLRGTTADATLQPLTTEPVVDTSFTDRSAAPGVRYVYAVVAVDARVPLPNISAESNRVEEAAR